MKQEYCIICDCSSFVDNCNFTNNRAVAETFVIDETN